MLDLPQVVTVSNHQAYYLYYGMFPMRSFDILMYMWPVFNFFYAIMHIRLFVKVIY